MRIGLDERDITPPVGIFLVGFAARKKGSDGVNAPLFLRTVALEDETGEREVIVSAVQFPRDMSWRVKNWCTESQGVPSASVLLNASHTHCGPYLYQRPYRPQWPLNLDYTEALEQHIHASVHAGFCNGVSLAPGRLKCPATERVGRRVTPSRFRWVAGTGTGPEYPRRGRHGRIPRN